MTQASQESETWSKIIGGIDAQHRSTVSGLQLLVEKARSEGVTLSTVKYTAGTITLRASADDSTVAIAYTDILAATGQYSDIQIKGMNIGAKEGVVFDLALKVKGV